MAQELSRRKQMTTERIIEPVERERLCKDAICVVIRTGLGGYELRGPAANILVPESYVAWSTVKNDLENEGYRLVTPEEYAATRSMTPAEVLAEVHEEGSLFALVYGESIVVPLPERGRVLPDIEV